LNNKENISHSLKTEKNIRKNPIIQNLLARMPQRVSDSFNEEQLSNLMTAVGSRSWGDHAVDKRGTFNIPFYKWRFYYVFLLGRNYRELSRKEKQLSLISTAIFNNFFNIQREYRIISIISNKISPRHRFIPWVFIRYMGLV